MVQNNPNFEIQKTNLINRIVDLRDIISYDIIFDKNNRKVSLKYYKNNEENEWEELQRNEMEYILIIISNLKKFNLLTKKISYTQFLLIHAPY